MDAPEPSSPPWPGRALVVAVALLLTAWCLREDVQPDLYFHLAAGRWIWEHGLPHSNVFLSAHPEHAFVDHEWLFQALAWPVWQLAGARGLALLKALGVLAAFAALAAAARPSGARLRWPVLAAATLLAGGRFVLRPEVVSFVGVALTIYVLTREAREGPSRRTLVALPLAQLLWSNSHGFSLLGPVLIGVTLATRLLHAGTLHVAPTTAQRLGPAPRGLRATALLLLGVSVASLINPYGLEAALYPFLVLLRSGQDAASAGLNYQVVELWSPFHPALAGQPEVILFKTWLVAGPLLWLFALARRKSSLEEGARMLLLCASALLYIRNLPFAAFGLIPVTVAGLGELWNVAKERLGRSAPSASLSATLLATVGVLFLARGVAADSFHQNASYDPRPGVGLGEFTAYPEAVAFLAENPPAGKLFNNFGAGHYLIYAGVSPRPYICGNTDLYPGTHLRRYAQVMRGERALGPILDEDGVSDVLLDHRVETPDHVIAALVTDPTWVLVHADRRAVVFRRAPATALDLVALGRRARTWEFPSEAPDAFPASRLLRALRLLPPRAPNPLHRLQVAQLLGRLGQTEIALDLARDAEVRHPKSELVLRTLATLAESAGHRTEAVSRWRALAAAAPSDPLPWVKLGLESLREGNARLARQHFEAALARDPGSLLARQNLLAALELGGDAIGLRQAMQRVPLDAAKRSYYRGVSAWLERDWERAEEFLGLAVRHDPSLSPALSRWAEVLGNLKRWPEAEAAWSQLCALTPKDASAWRALGRVQRLQGKQEAALETWGQAARASPTELEAILLAGALRVRRGERSAAQALLDEAKRRAPREPRVAKFILLVEAMGRER
jgi:tetratricopeptide (TPR) repeat protein